MSPLDTRNSMLTPKRDQSNGHLRPTDFNILIVGVIRNGETSLYSSFKVLEESFYGFKEIQWLFIESDSDDNTLTILEQLADQVGNFRFISAGLLRDEIPQRTARIAYCRNIYINEILTNPIYCNVDYVAVVDLDGINSDLTSQAVQSCWSRTDWDVCTANQKHAYYDIWALRHPIWSPNDCWEQHSFMSRFFNANFSLVSCVISKMIEIPENSGWIEVDSAFGGLAIYRREVIFGQNYVGLNNAGTAICEHISFHKEIKNHSKRIFINPKLINGGLNEHSIRYAQIFQSNKIVRS